MDFKAYLDSYRELLPVGTSISYTEAEKRAGLFLEAMAQICDWKHTLGVQKIKAQTIQTATFAQEMSKGTSKTMTQDKLIAEASNVYVAAREELELIDNDISYLKAYYDIFNQGHLYYRQMARQEFA